MDKRPFTDHSILLPIGISVFSIAGILIVFLAVLLDQLQVGVSADPTATPFTYLLIAPETSISNPAFETGPRQAIFTEEPAGSVLLPPAQAGFTAFPTEASSPTNPPVNNTLSGAMTTPPASTAVLNVIDRYDDTDSRLEYDGDWVSQTNVGNAYQRTLFVSNTIGNDLILSFEGRQIVIGYLGAPGLGSVVISIDDEEFQLDQSVGKEWISPQFENTEHFVIVIHESGDSVNLDYINILGSE